MKFFKFISKIDVSAAKAEVIRNQIIFQPHTSRPEESPPLREGKSIHLRVHNSTKQLSHDYINAHELADGIIDATDTHIFKSFPECKKLIDNVLKLLPSESRLGKCYIAKMIPGGNIYPHVDPGHYFKLYDRYHVVLKTNPGVSFSCGDNDEVETVRFEEGELWVFDNKVKHWATNQGDSDRIHIIMDVMYDSLQFPH